MTPYLYLVQPTASQVSLVENNRIAGSIAFLVLDNLDYLHQILLAWSHFEWFYLLPGVPLAQQVRLVGIVVLPDGRIAIQIVVFGSDNVLQL